LEEPESGEAERERGVKDFRVFRPIQSPPQSHPPVGFTIAEKLRPRILERRPPLSTLEPPERDSAPVLADPRGPLAEPSTLEGGWPSWFGCWEQNLVHMLYPYQCFGIPQRAGRQHSVGAVEGSVQFRHRSDFWLSLGYPGGRLPQYSDLMLNLQCHYTTY